MLARKTHLTSDRPWRAGFSLIELMIVLVIISILAAFILPAVMSSGQTVRVFEVNNEMEKFKASITQFKVTFGVEPPSSITIWETAAGWQSNPRDRRIIKQLWPQFDFGYTALVPPGQFDFDLDGTFTSVPLDGAECLVLFLGGIVDVSSGALHGFSKNPRNPFANDYGSRDGPFFEFKGGFDVSGLSLTPPILPVPTGRLVDTDGDSLPEYLDTLPSQTQPYVYFSSYGGAGYRNADNSGRITAPYFKDALSKVPYNQDSFQLISPGLDYQYGSGGQFDPDNPPSSTADSDNIANFHSGLLGG
jgi:prepilin-type N-terminal cleavage/methylation domain-containing protein